MFKAEIHPVDSGQPGLAVEREHAVGHRGPAENLVHHGFHRTVLAIAVRREAQPARCLECHSDESRRSIHQPPPASPPERRSAWPPTALLPASPCRSRIPAWSVDPVARCSHSRLNCSGVSRRLPARRQVPFIRSRPVSLKLMSVRSGSAFSRAPQVFSDSCHNGKIRIQQCVWLSFPAPP